MNLKQEMFNGFNDKIAVFSRHFKSMECEADKLVLRYRYTLDELALLLQGKLLLCDIWIIRYHGYFAIIHIFTLSR